MDFKHIMGEEMFQQQTPSLFGKYSMAGDAALLIPYHCLMYLVARLSKGLMLSTEKE